ncbi:MAG TPA: YihY/virulence factor BrkB family protein [Herpetosiphonaceae bacterium]|nr:YihY/virulence factor BrkB family protein [Herpetosiphonaceae bacterium]
MELGRGESKLYRWWRIDLDVIRRVARSAHAHDISATATQVAFHATFAFFPALMVLAAVLTTIDVPWLFTRVLLALQTILPPSAMELVTRVLEEVERGSNWGIVLSGLSLALWSAVSGLHVLICAINTAHLVEDDRPYWKRSLLAVLLTLLLVTLLLAASALVIGGRWLGVRLSGWFGYDSSFLQLWVLLRWPAILVAVIGGLLVLYTAAPKLPITPWRALPGAVLGGGLWVAVTSIFAWYIGNFASYNRVYGSIGGVIVLMLWLYVGGVVILLGAELNGVLYRRRYGPP